MNDDRSSTENDRSDHSEATGLRSINDMDLDQLGVLAEPLEPGDIVFGRGTGNWISDTISSFDGYWSHVGIVTPDPLDDEPLVAEALLAGVTATRLSTFVERYPGGVGLARPAVNAATREAAAAWASTKVPTDDRALRTSYASQELGMAFALMRRVRARHATKLLSDPGTETFAELAGEADLLGRESLRQIETFRSTCSGLVFGSYADGATHELDIDPAPGLVISDGHLHLPDDDLAGDALRSSYDTRHEAVVSDRVARGVDLIRFVAGIGIGMVRFDIEGGRVPLAQGVSPGDLWTSPDMAYRAHFTDAHRRLALDALGTAND